MSIESANQGGETEVVGTCITDPECGTLEQYPPLLRLMALKACQDAGITISCRGPQTGLVHPICGLSNLAKCALAGKGPLNLGPESHIVDQAQEAIAGISNYLLSRAV